MGSSRSKILISIVFLVINIIAFGQQEHIEIFNYDLKDTTNAHIKCSSIQKFIEQKKAIKNLVFSNLLRDYNIDTLLIDTNSVYIGKAIINPKYFSLFFVSKLKPDTDCLESISYRMYLLNYNKSCNLVSSALIAKYDRINSGLSFTGNDTEMIFKKNTIKSKIIHDAHPIDLKVKFEYKKEIIKYLILMDENGKLILKK